MQEIGGFGLENIKVCANSPIIHLPLIVPMIYNGYARKLPLDAPAVAIKLAQMFDKRSGAPRFASREELEHNFAIASGAKILVSGVDKDPVIERWWGIGNKARLKVIEAIRSIGVSMVTAPNFSVCVDWPRHGDLAAIKRIALAYAEFMNGGVSASLHVNGRTEMDFLRWAKFLQENEAVSHISYEFSTGAAFGERRAQHIGWLKGLASSLSHPLHLILYGDCSVVRELQPSFGSIVFVETSSFIKTIKRQEPIRKENGRLEWRTRRSAPDEDLSYRLQVAVKETRALIAIQIAE